MSKTKTRNGINPFTKERRSTAQVEADFLKSIVERMAEASLPYGIENGSIVHLQLIEVLRKEISLASQARRSAIRFFCSAVKSLRNKYDLAEAEVKDALNQSYMSNHACSQMEKKQIIRGWFLYYLFLSSISLIDLFILIPHWF